MIGQVGKGKQPKPTKGEPKPKKPSSTPRPPENDDLYDSGDICTPEPERDDEAMMQPAARLFCDSVAHPSGFRDR